MKNYLKNTNIVLFIGATMFLQLSCVSSKSVKFIGSSSSNVNTGTIVIERATQVQQSGMKAYILDRDSSQTPNSLHAWSTSEPYVKGASASLYFYYPLGSSKSTVVFKPKITTDLYRLTSGGAKIALGHDTIDWFLKDSENMIYQNDRNRFVTEVSGTPSLDYKTTIPLQSDQYGRDEFTVRVRWEAYTTVGLAGNDTPLVWERPAGTASIRVILHSGFATFINDYTINVLPGKTSHYILSTESGERYATLKEKVVE